MYGTSDFRCERWEANERQSGRTDTTRIHIINLVSVFLWGWAAAAAAALCWLLTPRSPSWPASPSSHLLTSMITKNERTTASTKRWEDLRRSTLDVWETKIRAKRCRSNVKGGENRKKTKLESSEPLNHILQRGKKNFWRRSNFCQFMAIKGTERDRSPKSFWKQN